MAIVALVVWTCTVAAGVYLLVSSTRPGAESPTPPVSPVPVAVPPDAPTAAAPPASTATDRTRFDPPSLARAKAEPIPGLRAFGEFIHPLLGIIGFGLFVGYALTRTWILGAIALGVGIGTVAAGASWAVVNARAARREVPDRYAMSVPPRLLLLHGVGAAVTILLAALIVARV
jgi:hypothetical protein